MRVKYIFSFILLTGILVNSFYAIHADDLRKNIWRVAAVQGNVFTTSGDINAEDKKQLVADDYINLPALVITGNQSTVELKRNDDSITVAQNSIIKLIPDNSEDSRAIIKQEKGSVLYNIVKRFNKNFKVITPYLIAGVKGTIFTVSVDNTQASVELSEGLLEITSSISDEKILLTAGNTVTQGQDNIDFNITSNTIGSSLDDSLPEDIDSLDNVLSNTTGVVNENIVDPLLSTVNSTLEITNDVLDSTGVSGVLDDTGDALESATDIEFLNNTPVIGNDSNLNLNNLLE
tara:strand:- start:1442 stop:2311 length:870 start_codon:yes stop_codon:yes gene_type:complete